MSCRPGLVAGLSALLLLTACGFQPLYGRDQAADASAGLADVKINFISDRRGQILRNELLDRINPRGEPAQPRYRLTVTVDESVTRLGIQADASATRARLTLAASFTLTDQSTDDALLTGSARSLNSYNISSSDFATDSAEEDARRRGARDLAEGITTRIAIFLSQIEPLAGRP